MTFKARVIPGHGIGRKLGFPTLNFEISENFDLTPGVYACRISKQQTANSKQNFGGVLFFGTRATFEDEQPTLEVHLLDSPEDSIIKEAKIKVLKKIREPQKFSSKEELIRAIEKDCITARAQLNDN